MPSKVALLLVILLLGGLVGFGCVRGTVAKGWSGTTIVDGSLFVGSMEGKLVAMDVSDGSRLWVVPLETSVPGGGGFGCAPGTGVVAIYGSPAVAGDLVYVGGYDGKIYAFAFGKNEWEWEYPRRDVLGPIVGGLVVVQDSVYFGSSNGKIYALEAEGLFEKWDKPFETDDKIWSTPAIDGDTLFIGSFDKKLYALNASDGSLKWEFETTGAIVATPVVSNNTVFIGSFDRYLYAIDAADGSLRWKFMADNWFWATPVVHDGVVYAGNLDGKVYALNAKSGDELVEFDLGSPVSSAPVLAGNLITVATEEGVIYTLNTDNNQQRQLVGLEKDKVYAPLAVSQGIVYVHTDKDALYAVNAQTGAIRKLDIN